MKEENRALTRVHRRRIVTSGERLRAVITVLRRFILVATFLPAVHAFVVATVAAVGASHTGLRTQHTSNSRTARVYGKIVRIKNGKLNFIGAIAQIIFF